MYSVYELTGMALWLIGLGATYFSRFYLRKNKKLKSVDLGKISPRFTYLRRDYLKSYQTTFFIVVGILFIVYELNKDPWIHLGPVLFAPTFAIPALFDGILALRTAVFPTTTWYDWDSFVYDKKKEFYSIAKLQIGLGIFIVICFG